MLRHSVFLTFVLIGSASLALDGCSRSTVPERRAEESRPVTIVGCLRTGTSPEDLVLVGRAVGRTVTTATGTIGRGGLTSTTTMRGGDPDRNFGAGTREEWASKLAPRLIGGNRDQLEKAVGYRVVVTGQFVPAPQDETTDEVRVESMQPVSAMCEEP